MIQMRRDLAAVAPIDLIAVVFRSIVACCNDNTRRRTQLPDTEGQHGCRLQFRIQIGPDPIGAQNLGGIQRKIRGLPSGIIGNDDAACHRFVTGFFDIVRQPLGCLGHSVTVHPIGTCSDDASQASRAEFQILIEPVLDLLVFPFQRGELLFGLFIYQRAFEPHLILLPVIHIHFPLLSRACISIVPVFSSLHIIILPHFSQTVRTFFHDTKRYRKGRYTVPFPVYPPSCTMLPRISIFRISLQ